MGSVAHERAKVANAIRYDHPPDAVAAARSRLAEAKLERHIREVVDAAPPLTDEQRTRLSLLLAPGGSNAAT